MQLFYQIVCIQHISHLSLLDTQDEVTDCYPIPPSYCWNKLPDTSKPFNKRARFGGSGRLTYFRALPRKIKKNQALVHLMCFWTDIIKKS